ncbi:hypothetical protein SLS55_000201 [Diplodia seriata]|uniref:Zn(2)-C6 fungal-type domain-containing protein n=1 Tax=Diplodia seriata TaxID=420778 RepID=A0ABR3CTM7_9PEZI
MSKRSRFSEDEIKRVLAAKKRPRGKGACYPCNQRKVKCDMNNPCGTCVKRDHPDICVYNHNDASETDDRRQTLDHPSPLGHESRMSASAAASGADAPGNSTSFLGENSAASYLRQMGGAESPIARDIVPALGLRNTRAQYPFINAETEDEKSRELAKLLPTHREVLSFYHVYRAVAFPLAPLIVDIGDFESHLGAYLERLAGSNPTGLTVTNEREEAARMALLLATLAAGAQYSERDALERRRISRDFVRSFLDLHSMSVYPTRSWTCIHEALSSALLLTILGETRKFSALGNMQKRLIDVLLSRAQDDSPGSINSALTSSHLNALKALQRLMQEASERAGTESVGSQQDPHQDRAAAVPADLAVPQSDNLGIAATDSAFDFLQSDLSPMAFLDSIIWDKSLPEDDTSFLGFEFGD